jgi:two-component system, NarL family, sensor kinase
MPDTEEIYFVVIFGILLGLLLVGFIITMIFLYQRSRHRQEKEMAMIKDKYEKEILRSQLEIQENTFKAIAQELHDNIGQMLSVVKLSLATMPIEKEHKAFELSQHSQQVLSKAIQDLSGLTKSLYTDRIKDVGLAESIQFELFSVEKAGIIKVAFNVSGTEFLFPEQKAIFLFRIFQESLNNTLKHANATQIEVSLNYQEPNIFVMEIKDNGAGFSVEDKINSVSSGKGVGLKSIINRAHLIGASIGIQSKAGEGTTTFIKLTEQPDEYDKKIS